MIFTFKQVLPKIYLFQMEKSSDVAKVFCRFQEHYESPEFRGKIFTLDEYKEWYSKEEGGWTYYEDWKGFNIPSNMLWPFNQGFFDPLSKHEMLLINACFAIRDPFYVIGCATDTDPWVLKHELCHGLYHTNEAYRISVQNVLKNENILPLFKYIKDMGYHDSVVMDECHAYLSTSQEYLEKEGMNNYPELSEKLIKIREKFGVK